MSSRSSGCSPTRTRTRRWALRRPAVSSRSPPPSATSTCISTHPARSRPPSPATVGPTRRRSPRWSRESLRCRQKPTPADAADALALAICHCWRAPMIARMAAAEAMAAEQQRKYKATIKAKAKAGTMIASVRGEVLDIALDHVVIEAAGVGYKVMATPATLATLHRGGEARLITAMIVREDSMTLYGFADADARNLFLTLLAVSGHRAEHRPRRAGDVRRADAAAGDRRRRHHRADPDSQGRQEDRRADGAEPARQDGGDRPRPAPPRSTAIPCAALSSKRLSALALRSSRPRRPPTRCSPTSPRPTSPVRCARRCRCWARSDGPIRGRANPKTTAEREVRPALTVGEGDIDASLRPRSLGEFIGQPRVREQLQLVLEGAKNRGGTPDHILLSGPPGLGKTSLAMIIAAELGTSLRVTSGPALERAGDLAAMLSEPRRARRAVHRRDPPHRPARRGDALPRDGGLPRRRHRRQRPGRHVDSARGRAVHAGRCHHPLGCADRPAARPVRLHRPHGLLRTRRTGAGADPLGRHPRHRATSRRRSRRSPAAPVARRASPTGCCAGCATTPRCVPTVSSPATSPSPRWRCTTSTSSGSTGSTAPYCRRSPAVSAAVPSGCRRWPSRSGRKPRRSRRCASRSWCVPGMIARTPRGRVATAQAWTHLGMTPPAGATGFGQPGLFE